MMEETQKYKKELRDRMKPIFEEFVAIEAINSDEVIARNNLEKQIRELPQSLEFLCGMAEGVRILTATHPFSNTDLVFRLSARLVIVTIAKMALEIMQEESFPEELENE